MNSIIIQKDKKIYKSNFISLFFATLSIYSGIIPLLMLDIWVSLYQIIYFSTFKIPMIKRSEYVVIDRYNLSKLNFKQKINCMYCGYANGIVAFVKAIVNQTEIYSCAIKHKRKTNGQEHHTNFYNYIEFE